MPQRHKIAQLPENIRELVDRLIRQNRTIDEIHEKLLELDVEISRSSVGRYAKEINEVGEQLRKTREISQALVERFGEAPEDKTARLNIQLMQGIVMQMLNAGDDGNPVTLTPQQAMFMARTLDHLGKASRADVAVIKEARAEERKIVEREMAERIDQVLDDEGGLSGDMAASLRSALLGVRPQGNQNGG